MTEWSILPRNRAAGLSEFEQGVSSPGIGISREAMKEGPFVRKTWRKRIVFGMCKDGTTIA
jgi:hypothetical protein